jgi:putative nucleotidyltransferase with HDIG domain
MMPPGLAADETRRSTNLRTSMTPSSVGTDGTETIYPFWGRVKDSAVLRRFIKALDEVETRMRVYAAAVAGTAACVALSLVVMGHGLGNLWAVAALCIAAAVAQRGRIELGRNLHASISTFPVLLAAVLFGPLAAMPVALASMLAEPFHPRIRWLSYASTRSITAAAAGLVAFRFESAGSSELASLVAAACAAALAAQSLDVAFGALVFRLRVLGSPWSLLGTVGPLLLASIPLYAPVVALLVFGYGQVSPWVLPLFLAPALAAQKSFVLYQHERRLTEDLVAANQRLERANLSFATALVATLDARDRYTAGHSAAVAIYARDIANRMGLTHEEQKLAHLCGLVHDIGKIGLAPGLLEKPGALTLDERRQMETHSEIGERILANVDDYAEIAKIVRHHHERVDGQGYPDGLHSEEIPLISRIIAVADAYDAMTSDRPYRDAMPSRVARLRLAQAVESQFDTAVVAAFEAILAGASEQYRLGAGFDFRIEARDQASELSPVAAVA